MTYSIYDFVGNIGVALIVLTYLLLQMEKMQSSSWLYSFVNAIAATLIIISLMQKFNLSAFVVEAFWLIISLGGLIRFFIKKRKNAY